MFETAEVGQRVSKAIYKTEIPRLRVDLINAQYDLRDADFTVILVLAGDDRMSCNAVLHHLHDVMDARYMATYALGSPSESERERPRFWRYWRALSPQGQIGVFLGAWPIVAIQDRILGKSDDVEYDQRLVHIRNFEQALVDDGALLLKFWLHLPKKQLKKRLKIAKKRSEQAWQLTEREGLFYDLYDECIPQAERLIRETSTGQAPWFIIESTDERYRQLVIDRIILQHITTRLGCAPTPLASSALRDQTDRQYGNTTILDTVDLTKTVTRPEYRNKRSQYQGELSRLTRQARTAGVTSILLFEGWDAAGKGGVIRRITAALDPELYHVIPIAAPTEEERARHYLWRFWRYLPRAGRVLIFDRSWYGRVLVERVEALTPEAAWQRAYSEINDFEQQLCDHGISVLKFWLHIDPDEQWRRFQARQETPYKKYKLTEEDYRNRDKWPDYERAVHDMVERTSTTYAPWHLVPSNDKRWARIYVLETFCRALEQRFQLSHDKLKSDRSSKRS